MGPDIVGLRNIAVHEYFGVRWETVWNTAMLDVPVLRDQIAAILAAEFPAPVHVVDESAILLKCVVRVASFDCAADAF